MIFPVILIKFNQNIINLKHTYHFMIKILKLDLHVGFSDRVKFGSF